jgi:hypothetical protein
MNNVETKALPSQLVRRMIFIGLVVVSSFVAIALLGVASSVSLVEPVKAAQEGAITGEWLADFNRENSDEVQFTILRRTARGGNFVEQQRSSK